jgi:chloride channel protein, CIC family
LRLLVACGAASGMAAAYNAPVAGSVFAAQIVLGNFSMNLFAPLVFASVIATMVSRSFFGLESWYEVPAFDIPHISQLHWFLLLGILCGGLGAIFLKGLRTFEDLFSRLHWPILARLALSGLIVGALAIFFPEVWGNGYSVTNQILHERLEIWFLVGVFLAKALATLVTVGSGAVGGVFTPTLFLGAAAGSIFGTLVHWAGWADGIHVGAFALVGMGSVLAGTVHSPLLALIMIFEISLNFSLLAPLMLACVVSTLVARRLHPESVYTAPLRRKGVRVDRENQQIGAATQTTVGEIMRERIAPLRETTSFTDIVQRFLTGPNNFLPVVDASDRLVGVVALQDLKEYLNLNLELSGVIAYDVMRPAPPCLNPNQHLMEVLPLLLSSELRNIPVVNNSMELKLVGAVTRSEALGLLSEVISARTAPATQA